MNQPFTVFDPVSGKILKTGYSPDYQAQAGPGEQVLPIESNWSQHYMVEGVPTEFPARPFPICVFDYTTKQWCDPRTIEDYRATQWALIKDSRSSQELGGFTWDGSVFDSDAISQGRIQGAVQLVSVGGGSISWTLADNTVRILTAENMISVGIAMANHIDTCHSKARALRVLIDAASTFAEIEAIVW